MTAPVISKRALEAAICAAELVPGNPAINEALAWLRAHRAALDRPTVRVVPTMGDAWTWEIDGTTWTCQRGSIAFWAYWMAMRDGWAQCSWLDAPPNSIRNARQRLADALEHEGHRALASEVRRCQVGSDGRVTYRPGTTNLAFE